MRGNRLSRAAEGNIVAKHAGYQMGRGLEFQRLGLASKLADQRFEQAKARIKMDDKRRELRNDAFNFQKRLFGDELSQRKKDMRWTIGLGLGTAGLSYFEGRRRSNELEEEKLRRSKWEKGQEEYRDKEIEIQERLMKKLETL